jgi:transposase InsO family protein
VKDWKKAEEIAVQRFQLLSPLLAEGLDAAKLRELKAQVCKETGLSERTVRRYLSKYRNEGFGGLKPQGKPHPSSLPSFLSQDLLEEAILLRREVPTRSVSQIIEILEWEGKAAPGQLKRSTLQDHLAARGYSSRHMRMYAETGTASRRFQQKHRNQLWQSDIKYGPYLPIGSDGTKQQVYLVVMLDDTTRFVLHGGFYASLDKSIVTDCFRQAVQKYGVPEAVYFDNGSQFRSKWMSRTCSKLGTRLLFTKPYSPEAKGKVERFNRTVDSFLSEVAIDKPQTLERLNEQLIQAIHPGPNLSKRNLKHKIYPYLLRNITPSHPNHVWGIDITYVRLKHGWMYLVAVIDWYSRFVVSWQLSDTLEMPFVVTAVRSALKQAKPEIWNSDQGSHFTSDQYIGLLKDAKVQISMDGKNRALDNIITERFWRTLKYDHVYLREYTSPKEARQQIGAFIHEYNYDRPHQSLGYRVPAEFYFQEDRAHIHPPSAI